MSATAVAAASATVAHHQRATQEASRPLSVLTLGEAASLTPEQKAATGALPTGALSRPGAAPAAPGATRAPMKRANDNRLFFEDFSASDALKNFTVLDVNNDGKCWTIQDQQARMAYSMKLQMDDWMITRAISLEKGKAYTVSIDARASASYGSSTETIELKAGKSPTAEAMTITVIETTDLVYPADKEYRTLTGTIVPEETGNYYIGVHGLSVKAQNYLYVDNLSVSAPIVAVAPDAVTGLAVTPAPLGATKATVTFTTPAIDLAGDAISELDRVEIVRGETLVKTFTAPAVNTALDFTDEVSAEGLYTYTVTAYNGAGKGREASAEVYIGTGLPASLTEASVVETSKDGEVTISWEPVTTNTYGTAISPDAVSYNIYLPYGNTRRLLIEGVRGSSYTCQAAEEGMQGFVQYLVYPATAKGEGKGAPTPLIPVGTPYDGMHESGTLDYALSIDDFGGASWGLGTAATIGYPAQDGDDLFFTMRAWNLDEYADLITAKISLAAIEDPYLTFYVFNAFSDIEPKLENTNEITVMAKNAGTAEFTPLVTKTLTSTGPVNRWNRIAVDLSAYKGRVIQLCFRATAKAYIASSIDNLVVARMYATDLGVQSVEAPGKVKPGEDYAVTVKLTNFGLEKISGATVALYADGEKVGEKAVADMEGGDDVSVTFDMSMNRLATEPVTLRAEVKVSGDTNVANDRSEDVAVAPIVSKLPAVTDLAGNADGGPVKLTWSAPDASLAPADPVTEDFEAAPSFALELEGWKLVDVDGKPIGGFDGLDLPGITPGETTASFFVFDGNYPNDPTSFKPHSGDKFLASMFRHDYGQTDDWAISPELDGSEQTVSLWARSFHRNYPETIELYYSTGSVAPADFVKIGETHAGLTTEWTQFTAELPEGAKRFAFRSCAANAFMLMVDDVTFIPEGAVTTAAITGYNVYRNGVKITDTPVAEPSFTDTPAEDGPHSYAVTTVYNHGESAPSNFITVAYSGIEDITTDRAAEYFNLQGIGISAPVPGTVVIRRCGDRVEKIVVR